MPQLVIIILILKSFSDAKTASIFIKTIMVIKTVVTLLVSIARRLVVGVMVNYENEENEEEEDSKDISQRESKQSISVLNVNAESVVMS